MGVFIKNKGKRVSKTNQENGNWLNNNNTNPVLIGEEKEVPGKRSIKGVIRDINKQETEIAPLVIKNKVVEDEIIEDKTLEPNTPQVETVKIENKINHNDSHLAFIDLDEFKDFIKNKTIVLVANSSDLLKKDHGWFIDNHDIIIRFNSFLIDEKYTGIETTMHVAFELMDSCYEYYVPIRFITSTTVNFSTLNRYNQSYVLRYDYRCYDEVFTKFEMKMVPTTGFKVLRLLLHLGGFYKINLVGFNFYKYGKDSVFRTVDGFSTDHDYEYEKNYIMNNCQYYDDENNIITFLQ